MTTRTRPPRPGVGRRAPDVQRRMAVPSLHIGQARTKAASCDASAPATMSYIHPCHANAARHAHGTGATDLVMRRGTLHGATLAGLAPQLAILGSGAPHAPAQRPAPRCSHGSAQLARLRHALLGPAEQAAGGWGFSRSAAGGQNAARCDAVPARPPPPQQPARWHSTVRSWQLVDRVTRSTWPADAQLQAPARGAARRHGGPRPDLRADPTRMTWRAADRRRHCSASAAHMHVCKAGLLARLPRGSLAADRRSYAAAQLTAAESRSRPWPD